MGTRLTFGNYEESAKGFPAERESDSSGVSWGAVIGGAFVASALYLILLALGAGFGLSVISPWSNVGISASGATAIAIVWLITIEIIASGFGGYLTGRLRTKWALVHSDEVFFRDTANGFLSWAVALVMSVAFLATAAASMAGSAAAGSAAQTRTEGASSTAFTDPNLYFVDALFRADRTTGGAPDTATKAEAGRILARSLTQAQMSATDRSYLARLVVAQSGISQAEAEQRVSEVMNEARQVEDAARKAAAHFLLWLFLSLLLGAFIASYAATIGGRQRDHVKPA